MPEVPSFTFRDTTKKGTYGIGDDTGRTKKGHEGSKYVEKGSADGQAPSGRVHEPCRRREPVETKALRVGGSHPELGLRHIPAIRSLRGMAL